MHRETFLFRMQTESVLFNTAQKTPASPIRCKVLETCVKNCGYRFHILVTTREFVEGVLVRSIIPRNNPPLVVHDRVLSIVQVQDACVCVCTQMDG